MKRTVLKSKTEAKKEKASLPKGGGTVERKSLFGRYADSEMLSQLKGLALDPCRPDVSRDSIRPLWNQTLKVREVMGLGDSGFPRVYFSLEEAGNVVKLLGVQSGSLRRKRKLQQFLRDKFRIPLGLASEASENQHMSKLSRGKSSHASSGSCLLNSVDSTISFDKKTVLDSQSSGSLLTFDDNFQGKLGSSESSVPDNATDYNPPNKDTSPLVDSSESVNGSNPSTPEDLTSHELASPDSSSFISNSDEPKNMHCLKPRRSARLQNFIGDHLQRLAIPIGPRFQANVPDWTGPAKRGCSNGKDSDSDSSRWLGTPSWPIAGDEVETTERAVGKGRSSSCLCECPGSHDCIKHHISEESLSLEYDLGPAFFDWKFDEMGEVVSKLWTLKEQQTFESLVKRHPQKNLLKHAKQSFPRKSRGCILRYYLNVFTPTHLSLQTCSVKEVDSDDMVDTDEIDLGDRSDGRNSVGSSRDVKYLRCF
ncbi:hypothetical protein RJ640_018387 [Escallonia rubra]|uniref:Uncharacterized protein n=1 Tax=Escallonia rubra TaxID=112253 RepID=A0AA88TZW9_9ASTE|nr:hypothetical protein RJ640_018387 [Escallonia rubra]